MFLNSLFVFNWLNEADDNFCSGYFDIKNTVYTSVSIRVMQKKGDLSRKGTDSLTIIWSLAYFESTVKLGDKERFDKEQIGVKELFTDYQPFYTINLLLDKELLPIQKMPKLGVSEQEIVKNFQNFVFTNDKF